MQFNLSLNIHKQHNYLTCSQVTFKSNHYNCALSFAKFVKLKTRRCRGSSPAGLYSVLYDHIQVLILH